MQFLSPSAFLLSFFIALVVLFYFFRKQFEEHVVPSNLLWKEVLNESKASPLFKKLQQNLLFWLQILILLFLMIALARPFWEEQVLKGDHIVFIIDVSATMSAIDHDQSRFEEAKKELREMAETIQGQEVTLITAGQNPQFLLNHETEKVTILNRIDSLSLTYEHENIEKALELAKSVSTDDNSSIYLFSDSVSQQTIEKSSLQHYVNVHNYGEKLENVSLASFGVSTNDEGITGVAVIENQSSKQKTVTLTIKGENSELFSQKISLKQHENKIISIPKLTESPYYEAAIASDDGYSVDNQMTAVYQDTAPSLYAVGENNPFVLKGFETIGADLLQVENENAKMDRNGIVIMESSSLENMPNQPTLLFMNSSDKTSLSTALTAQEDELLEYVQPSAWYISSAMKAEDEQLDTVLASGDIPLIQKGMRNGQPIIVVNFSLGDSDWPLRQDFPIFLYNSYQWLSQQTSFLGYFSPGEEKTLNRIANEETVEIYDDQDENISMIDTKTDAFKAPFLPGTYQAVVEKQLYYFTVMLDEQEKTTKTSASFTYHENLANTKSERKQESERASIWLAALAFILLCVEWEVFRREFRI